MFQRMRTWQEGHFREAEAVPSVAEHLSGRILGMSRSIVRMVGSPRVRSRIASGEDNARDGEEDGEVGERKRHACLP